jgi:hypothetical protein
MKKVICINSFNHTYYVQKGLQLLQNCSHKKCVLHVIIAFGGCARNAFVSFQNYTVVGVTQNLSDHNIYVACEYLENEGFVFHNASYCMIHDTCILSEHFEQNIASLPTVDNEWIFAHTYGLYNIGICDYKFILRRAKDFKGITEIPKRDGIRLEQGHEIVVQGLTLKPLSHYSNKTLTKTLMNCDVNKLISRGDAFFINGYTRDNIQRYVSYIGSLGIYKLVGTTNSFIIPVWASKNHIVETDEDMNYMRKIGPVQLICDDIELGKFEPWIPYVPMSQSG